MSVEARITLTLEDGEWFATDDETELTGHGETRRAALEHLDELLAHEAGDVAFSEEFSDAIESGERDAAEGRTESAEAVRRRLGIDD